MSQGSSGGSALLSSIRGFIGIVKSSLDGRGSDGQTDDAGVLCGAYGRRTLELVGFDLENEGRLTHPMVYDQATDRYLEISWEALAKIGAALRALPYPDMAEFYTSGWASNEAAFLYQLFAREYGTNNFLRIQSAVENLWNWP
jgi:hypothetical protein